MSLIIIQEKYWRYRLDKKELTLKSYIYFKDLYKKKCIYRIHYIEIVASLLEDLLN